MAVKLPTIRLDSYRKSELAKFAVESVANTIRKEEIYKEYVEMRDFISQGIIDKIHNKCNQTEMKILEKHGYAVPVKRILMSGKSVIMRGKDLYCSTFLDDLHFIKLPKEILCDTKYVSNRFGQFEDYFDLSKIDTHEMDSYWIYINMLNELIRSIECELCPFQMIIEKKTTLGALIKVWPQAIKFKDLWYKPKVDDNKIIRSHCGIMAEDEISQKISKHAGV